MPDALTIIKWLLVIAAIAFTVRIVVQRIRASRSGRTATGVEPLPQTPAWRWARAASGLILGTKHVVVLTPTVARKVLDETWGILDRTGLEAAIAAMDGAETDRPTWRLVRTIALTRLALVAGIVDEAHATGTVEVAATQLRKLHTDWKSLGDAFLEEHEAFMQDAPASGSADARRAGRHPRVNVAEENRAILANSAFIDVQFHTGKIDEAHISGPKAKPRNPMWSLPE